MLLRALATSVTPKPGRAVLWPSVLNEDLYKPDFRTMHEAAPVTAGTGSLSTAPQHAPSARGTARCRRMCAHHESRATPEGSTGQVALRFHVPTAIYPIRGAWSANVGATLLAVAGFKIAANAWLHLFDFRSPHAVGCVP